MASQVLRDRNNAKIGEIKEMGGRLVVFDKNNSKCGSFDPKTNITYDKRNTKVGTGNLLTTLLPI